MRNSFPQENLFADLPSRPAEHFKLYFYAAVSHVIEQASLSFGSHEAALEQFPFLGGYYDELERRGVDQWTGDGAGPWWLHSLRTWEAAASQHLPLRALRETAGLKHSALTMLLSVGLIEEDARFGSLFESMQGLEGQHRPTVGLLSAWWREPDSLTEVRANLRQLLNLGLLQIVNPDAPRTEWALGPPGALWDVLRGEKTAQVTPWGHYREPGELAELDQLILPDEIRQKVQAVPSLLASGQAQALLVRGPQHNGRRTLVGAAARALDRGLLEIGSLSKVEDERWRLVGPLATLLHALPLLVLDPAPGETAELPPLNGYCGPIGLVLGKQGGVSGPGAERAITINLDIPDVNGRRQHWLCALDSQSVIGFDAISERFRMTGGNIRRTASLAVSYAALEGRKVVFLEDIQQASRALNRQTLDTLAVRVRVSGDWSQLAVAPQTLSELRSLENRCRHRERLHTVVGPALGAQLNAGVRALFSGPSGTGKTLAARLLASVLQMDLYKLELSSIVNKYLGVTEQNLSQVFARAEELDVILLLDEGDALLTQRTDVRSSNDRYANLETNYLLQRLETFEGILIVTTNASDRIDTAFQRRMDVVVDFRLPEAAERWTIWQLHLPADCAVDTALLREISGRCAMTGGQIRNAVLHAALLALGDGGIVTSSHLEAAVQREYRKSGAVCPLRHSSGRCFSRE